MMGWKKTVAIIIIVGLIVTLYGMMPITANSSNNKDTERIVGGVYSPGDDYGSVASDIASYGTAAFYTPDTDQPTTTDVYDVQYYNTGFNRPMGANASEYPVYYGNNPWWNAPEYLQVNTPGVTEYMVIVEVINGVNGWTDANYTGSTNITATGDEVNYLPNIYLEQIPIPRLKNINYASGQIIINWTGLDENISDNCLDETQTWKNNTNNILNYSVYRSINNDDFLRIGNSTPQTRGDEVYFIDMVEPGDYRYRIAVNYRYKNNTGTSVIDQNGMNPENTKGLPGIFVSTGISNASEIITMPSKPVLILNSPNGDQVWTGGSAQKINYTVSEGTAPYTIYFNYTANGTTHPIGVDTKADPGTYTYPWTLPRINSTSVEVRVTVTDTKSLSDMEISTAYFMIDSKAPNVSSITPSDGAADVGRTDSITVTFDEAMNISAKDAFSISPSAGNWSWTWINDYTMTGTHDHLFVSNTTYTCTIDTTVKDKSLPGNSMSANYSWSFKVGPSVSVTIISPLGGEKWTGNTLHDIIYMVGGGTPYYTIFINYTLGSETFNIATETNMDEGSHSCLWVLPTINSSSVTMVVKAIDSLGATNTYISGQFTIDTIKPEIIINSIIPGDDTIAVLTQPIILQFTKPMNTTSAETGFIIIPNPGGWLWTWNPGKTTMTGTHNPFISGAIYTSTVTATDNTDPGNPLNASYTWVFTAVTGRGDLTVTVDYPSSPEVDKNYKITMKIYNNGPRAVNVSGSLIITFYMDNKIIDTKNIPPILKDTHTEVSSEPFTFNSKGAHTLKVRIIPTNQDDLIQGYAQPYEETHTVDVVQPIGIGPYLLIIVMVALVAVVGVLTIFLIKKNMRIKKIINDWAKNRTAEKKIKEEKINGWAKKRMEEKLGRKNISENKGKNHIILIMLSIAVIIILAVGSANAALSNDTQVNTISSKAVPLTWADTTGGDHNNIDWVSANESENTTIPTHTTIITQKTGTTSSSKALTGRAPIYINANSGFTAANGVTSGVGTQINPYIIENWDINANAGAGIEIRDTDVYFIIRNCVIHDGGVSGTGILFRYVINGKIDSVTSYNSSYGICIQETSSNNQITNCVVYNNSNYGIVLAASSNNTITNCNAYNNSYDGINIQQTSSSNNIITNCNAYNNSYGIYLLSSSNNNQITNCAVYNNTNYGIYLYSSSNNQISNCTAYNNSYGIFLYSSSNNNIITNCNIYNNSQYGIYLQASSNNIITNCTVHNNYERGISLYSSSNSNQIIGCTIYNNSYGIYMQSAICNKITNSTIYNNSNNGIYMYFASDSQITNCTVYNNYYGIYLSSSSYSKIYYCNIYNNTNYGVYSPDCVVDATYCWWGNTTGPGGAGPGTGDSITSKVLYDPWLGLHSKVDNIVPYWQTSVPFTITATATDFLCGVNVTTLYYMYSSENSTWSGWTEFGTDEASPWSWDFTAPSGGGYYKFYTIAVNNTGFMEWSKTSEEALCAVDATAPNTAYELSGDNGTSYWYRTSVEITLIPSDATTGVNYTKYRIKTGNWFTGTCFTLTDQSNYIIYYFSVDYAGNAEEMKNFSFGIDKTVPELYLININSGASYTNSTNVTLTLSAYDGFSGLWQMRFGYEDMTWGDWAEWNITASWTLTAGDGEKKVYFKAMDKAGNEAPAIYDIIILDTISPVVVITAPTNDAYYKTMDVPAGAYTVVELNMYTAVADGWANNPEGIYIYWVNATDYAGNYDNKSVTYMVDNTLPVITVTGVTHDTYYKVNITPVITITDTYLNTTVITLNGNPFVSGTTVSVDGKYYLNVTANDLAGNTAVQNVVFTVDKTVPVITITGVTNNTYYNVNVIPVIIITDTYLSTTTIMLNSVLFVSGTTVSVDGKYYLNVTANDLAGNTATKNIVFRVDKTKPVITISGVSNNTYYNVNVTPVIIITDTYLNTTTIKLNNNPFVSGTMVSIEDIYYLNVSANDLAGNIATQNIVFTIDKTLPSITVTGVNNNTYHNTNVTPVIIIIDTNMDVSTITLNDAVFASGTIVSAEGVYYLNVTAADKANNVANQNIVFRVDKTPPTITVVSPTNGATNIAITTTISKTFNEPMNQTSVNASFIVYQDGSIIPVSGTYSWSGNQCIIFTPSSQLLPNTKYYCNVSTGAKDTAGNQLDAANNTWFITAAGVGVTVNSPNGDESWKGNTNYWVNYTISGGIAPYTIRLFYSTTGPEGPWTFIAYHNQSATGVFNYMWSVPTADSANCYVNVSVNDSTTSGYDLSNNAFIIDTTAPQGNVNTISSYWWNTSSIILPATASDNFLLKNITLYYAYSSNNVTWPMLADYTKSEMKTISGASWSGSFYFTPPGQGYYRFYTRAGDEAGNIQSIPADFQAIMGYDTIAPTSSVNIISSYWETVSPLTITATANDILSGLANIGLWYRYSADNSSWGGWSLFGNDTASPWLWSFNFLNGNGYYQFYSRAKDNATNYEAAPDNADAFCGFDNIAPIIIITTPISNATGVSRTQNIIIQFNEKMNTGSVQYTCFPDHGGWATTWNTDKDTVTLTHNIFNPNTTHTFNITAGKDMAGNNLVSSNTPNPWMFTTITDNPPTSTASVSGPCWKTSAPFNVTWVASDDNGLTAVALYYRYSTNNSTWGGWTMFARNNSVTGLSATGTFMFTTPSGNGFYEFYTLANDTLPQTEPIPASADTICGYDNVAPVTIHTVSGTMGNMGWYVSNVTISLLSNDTTSDVANTYYQINDGSTQTGTSILLTSSGTHTVRYWGVDNAGNTENNHTVTVKIDQGKPIVSLISPSPDAIINTNTPTLTWSGTDNNVSGISYYDIQVDNNNNFMSPEFSSNNLTTAQITTISLPDNIYYWQVRAVDNAGNIGDWTIPRIFTVNTGPPTNNTIIINNGDLFTKHVNVTLTLSADQNVYEMCFSNNNTIWSPWESFTTTKNWALTSNDELKIVYYKCRNQYGNESNVVYDTIILDTTPPTTTDNIPVGWQTTTVTVTLTPADVTSGVAYTYYKKWLTTATEPTIYTTGTFFNIITDGKWYIKYYSVDNATNPETLTTKEVWLDTTPSNTTDNIPAGWQNNTVTINLNASDTTSGVKTTYYKFWLTGSNEPDFVTGASFIINTDGKYYIEYYSEDYAGNNETSTTKELWLDTILPIVSIMEPQTGTVVNKENITIIGKITDINGVETAEIFVNNTLYNITLVDGNFTQTVKLSNGTNIIRIRGKDPALNWAETIIIILFDPTIPSLMIYSPGNNTITNNSLCLVTGITDPEYTLKINGNTITLNETGYFAENIILNEGLNLLNVTSINTAGTQTTIYVYIILDTQPPTNPLNKTITPSTWTNNNTFTIDWVNPYDTSGIAGVWYKTGSIPEHNQDGVYSTQKPLILSSISGSKPVYLWLMDNAGNTNHMFYSIVYTKYDPYQPNTTLLIFGTEGKNHWYISDVKIELSPTDNLSMVNTTYYNYEDSGWETYIPYSKINITVPGTHKIMYYTVDYAGNIEDTHTEYVRVDKDTPYTNITVQGNTGDPNWYVGNTTITIEGHDDTSGVYITLYRIGDEGGFNNYTNTFILTQDGTHQIFYYSIDFAGQQEPVRCRVIRIDITPPSSTLNILGTLGDNGWYITAPQITITAEDKVSYIKEIWYRLQTDEPWSLYTDPFQLTDDVYNLTYYCVNNADLTENQKTTIIKIDITSPVLPVITSIPCFVNNKNIMVCWTEITDVTSGLISQKLYYSTNQNFTTYEKVELNITDNNYTLFLSENTRYYIKIIVWDIAGNNVTSNTVNTMVDTIAPETHHSLTGQIYLNTYVTQVIVELYNIPDISGISTIYYMVDMGWKEYTKPFTLSENKTYVIKYYAVDNAGNNENIKTTNFKIDIPLAEPDVTIDEPDNAEVQGNTTINWDMDSPVGDTLFVTVIVLQTSNGFTFILAEDLENITCYTIDTNQLPNAEYYIKLIVKDQHNRIINSSTLTTIRVKNPYLQEISIGNTVINQHNTNNVIIDSDSSKISIIVSLINREFNTTTYSVQFYVDDEIAGAKEIILDSMGNGTVTITKTLTTGQHTLHIKIYNQGLLVEESTQSFNVEAAHGKTATTQPMNPVIILLIGAPFFGVMLFVALRIKKRNLRKTNQGDEEGEELPEENETENEEKTEENEKEEGEGKKL